MKRFALFLAIATIGFSVSRSGMAQPNIEANKVARQASEAAKNEDWDSAIDGFKKATGMDHKYAPNLAAALQQRATVATKQNRFPDAIADLNDAIKTHPSASAFELRAFVYARMNDNDHAAADYTDAIKMNPNDVRLYSYRAHIFANKNDFKATAADADKILKMKKGDPDALALKKWAEGRLQSQAQQGPPPAPSPAR